MSQNSIVNNTTVDSNIININLNPELQQNLLTKDSIQLDLNTERTLQSSNSSVPQTTKDEPKPNGSDLGSLDQKSTSITIASSTNHPTINHKLNILQSWQVIHFIIIIIVK